MGKRFRILVDVDLIGFGQDAEDFLRPHSGAIHVGGRREIGRRLDEAREQRGFGKRQVLGLFREIGMRRGCDAIIAAAEIDAIEVEFEDFLLREAAFEPERENEFLGFPAPGPLRLKEEVLGELLRDRRAALHDLA